jgi:uncharacterized protein YmfQ (DUF2313 family)
MIEQIIQISKQLLPTGRAFFAKLGGSLYRLFAGVAKSEEQAANDTDSILDSILPDNDGFSAQDATEWEIRLGIITNTSISLADRKAAILRKYNHPSDIRARQSAGFLQEQLRLAGYDVYVFENLVPDTPENVAGIAGNLIAQMGAFEFGQLEFNQTAGSGIEQIANRIDAAQDASFIAGTLKQTFFIGGNPLGTFATVDIERKEDFRQTVLRLKPAQSVAYTFLNYI